ncbi:A/G-specific adenine glycosylase [Candidatus Chloroploca sp. M-50]|uniref:Adenine DNA glycosylase n=1 Tax=Candidatus Chloroploca mongolica TaxID=2528176 RepID=A0ABS4DDB1_9CHLR|nr:A/G-specific adenine glycosylase [Candidatus Chloroploca mongolica]MBP1467426.1 A/G-specific adenine glycosylase [Candidatus Chloroploca mongolica]
MQTALLDWFAQHARDLPWRHTRDPYRILVAELMLQQTQVVRVLPKYEAFLAAFPDLATLAAAPTAEVIRRWAGLGYNRRAVNLQRAVQMVLQEHGGVFPRDVVLLRQLPGVGPYTAGAVACFAFEQDVAFMDTNIRRVLLRTHYGAAQVDVPGERALLAVAERLVPAGQGWTWNQALMELGALICTAATPACQRCPVRPMCRAYGEWQVTDAATILAMGAPLRTQAAQPRQRAAERRADYRSETSFVGSRRWYRGRIVDLLRPLPPERSLPLAELGSQLKPDFTPDEMAWLDELVQGLIRDGLVVMEDGAVRLP